MRVVALAGLAAEGGQGRREDAGPAAIMPGSGVPAAVQAGADGQPPVTVRAQKRG